MIFVAPYSISYKPCILDHRLHIRSHGGADASASAAAAAAAVAGGAGDGGRSGCRSSNCCRHGSSCPGVCNGCMLCIVCIHIYIYTYYN